MDSDDELEPGPGKATFLAREYRLRAEALETFPELADRLDDPDFDELLDQAVAIIDSDGVDDEGLA
jgi:hypothetical protein